MAMYDTIIIGAGMSGLAAGIRLAYFDQRVCILERHSTIGGLNSFYRLRGRDYDVGLHAVTNFTPPGTKRGPLAKMLRQLRFRWEDFALSPQIGSSVVFPGVELQFGNGLDVLEAEIAQTFPAEATNFRRLVGEIVDYDDLDNEAHCRSAREVVAGIVRDPLLSRNAALPADVVWQSARTRHGLWPVLYHVSQHIHGRTGPSLGGRAADFKEPGAALS